MIRIEHTVRIYRTVAEVFAFAGNPARDVHWTSSVIESEQVTPGPLQVGTRFRQHSRFLAVHTESTSEVAEYEPDRRICLKGGEEGQARGTECREFTSDDGDALFKRTLEVDVAGMFRMAEPLVAAAARRQVETDMSLLKTLLDARAEPRDEK